MGSKWCLQVRLNRFMWKHGHRNAHGALKTENLGQMFSPAANGPVSHMGASGFDCQLQLLTPNSCQSTPLGAVRMAQSKWVPAMHVGQLDWGPCSWRWWPQTEQKQQNRELTRTGDKATLRMWSLRSFLMVEDICSVSVLLCYTTLYW